MHCERLHIETHLDDALVVVGLHLDENLLQFGAWIHAARKARVSNDLATSLDALLVVFFLVLLDVLLNGEFGKQTVLFKAVESAYVADALLFIPHITKASTLGIRQYVFIIALFEAMKAVVFNHSGHFGRMRLLEAVLFGAWGAGTVVFFLLRKSAVIVVFFCRGVWFCSVNFGSRD